MVCLGNICRSPLAEGILTYLDTSHNFIIDSAGTSAYHVGEFPDERSIKIALKYNIDISQQRSRQFTPEDFDKFDVIYAMDTSNFELLMSLAKNSNDKQKIKLILNELNPNKNLSIPDPYYGGDEGFDNVFNLLFEACNMIIKAYN